MSVRFEAFDTNDKTDVVESTKESCLHLFEELDYSFLGTKVSRACTIKLFTTVSVAVS